MCRGRRQRLGRLGLALLAALGLACAAEWERAKLLDTPADYQRFLREHPDSSYTAEAQERLEYLRLRRAPSLRAFEQFQEQYPESRYLAQLAVMMEEQRFLAARTAGTLPAYEAFLEHYPAGGFSARARGNLEFLREGGYGGQLAQLAAFATRFPESDYAEEARRSAETLAVRERTKIDAVELVIEVDPATRGADDLARAFAERADGIYQEAGVHLVRAQPGEPLEAAPAAQLTIRHREALVETGLVDGRVAAGGILASTRVTLQRRDAQTPIWSRTFEFRGDRLDLRPGRSLLFSARAQRYWSSFFVPVTTWSTDAARRPAMTLPQPAVAVDAIADRAVVLFGDGTFRLLNLANPAEIDTLAEYSRPRDLSKWSGVRVFGRRVLVHGDDGIEIVELSGAAPQRLATFGREDVGSIEGATTIDDDFLVGGTRGLFLVSGRPATADHLLSGPIHGVARTGRWIFFVDDGAFRVSTLQHLREGIVDGSVRLGRVFGPVRIRPMGAEVALVANGTFVRIDLGTPSNPQIATQLRTAEAGVIHDAALVNDRIFLLGERGLLLLDGAGERVVDSVDVVPRSRLGVAGRHLVVVGAEQVQLVDATPFVWSEHSPAAGR